MSKLKNIILLVLFLLTVTPAYAQGSSTLINIGSSKELGKFLVGKDGLTLYSYPPDNVNESVCYDQCAKAWPPLMVDSADQITVAAGIPGKFATTTRKDGKLQVTYNGVPLYYWLKDSKAGDTTGHRVGRIWWVVPPATVAAEKLPKVGTVLVGPTGMTLYMFTKDTADTSTCYDQCATNWPPLLVKSADEIVPGVNLLGKWGTTKRKDDTLQVTYNGMPLYYWKDDKAIGDTLGEGVGKVWYTIVPETVGVKTDKDLGDILVTYDGMTLYTFANDTEGKNTCSGDCAKAWPAFNVLDGDRLAAPASVKGKLDTIKLANGSLQVTYNGKPLYVFAKDTAPGMATGQNVGNVWAVVKP